MTVAKTAVKKTAAKKTAARSGNPAKRATAQPQAVSSISDFKKRRGGTIISLPSGLAMKVRRVDIQAFLQRGEIPNSLLPLVTEALKQGQEVDPSSLITNEDGEADMTKVSEIIELMKEIAIESSLDPKLHHVPENDDDREDDLLYIDDIDETDLSFLYQYAMGGTADLEQFREELESDVASLAQMQGHRSKAK